MPGIAGEPSRGRDSDLIRSAPYGQAVVPAVVPEGPGMDPNIDTKEPKSGKPTMQPGIGSLCHFSMSVLPKAATNWPKSGNPTVPLLS